MKRLWNLLDIWFRKNFAPSGIFIIRDLTHDSYWAYWRKGERIASSGEYLGKKYIGSSIERLKDNLKGIDEGRCYWQGASLRAANHEEIARLWTGGDDPKRKEQFEMLAIKASVKRRL